MNWIQYIILHLLDITADTEVCVTHSVVNVPSLFWQMKDKGLIFLPQENHTIMSTSTVLILQVAAYYREPPLDNKIWIVLGSVNTDSYLTVTG